MSVSLDSRVQLTTTENGGLLECVNMEFDMRSLTLQMIANIAKQYTFVRFEPVDDKTIAIKCKHVGE